MKVGAQGATDWQQTSFSGEIVSSLVASLVMKGKAHNSVIKDKTRELNCFTFFYERNYELPGARKGLQIKETKRGEKEEEETGSWPKARELDFSKQEELIFNFKSSAIGILFQCNSQFYRKILMKFPAFMSGVQDK